MKEHSLLTISIAPVPTDVERGFLAVTTTMVYGLGGGMIGTAAGDYLRHDRYGAELHERAAVVGALSQQTHLLKTDKSALRQLQAVHSADSPVI